MADKPPVMTAPKVPEGYPLTPHPPTRKQHDVPTKIAGPAPRPKDGVGIPVTPGAVSAKLGSTATPRQTPLPDIHRPVNPPKGARS